MIKNEIQDKLTQIFEISDTHISRMLYAKTKVDRFLPLSQESYNNLSDDNIGFLDQFIFRFSKLQDLMGTRLFPTILDLLAEPISSIAFIDILNKLEKLEIIPSSKQWLVLRNIRNEISHEYPSSFDEQIEGMNMLFESLPEMIQIIENCKAVFDKYRY
ncbi:MAG: hypothetical protein C0593_08615 [Marinilabiliales bacterium]|nr:MAG: hypothetical protein C0593_08615 [Marinilabiliales bacterium]